MIEGTVEAMLDCNNLSYRWLKVYYALKDKILNTYGQFCDLTLQEWDDLDESECRCERRMGFPFECHCGMTWVHATHCHILMRYLLGSVFFHIPTDEFYYFNEEYQIDKESPHYEEMRPLCVGVMRKKKEKCWNTEKNNHAFQSLKWLLSQYGHLLHQEVAGETQ